MLATLIRIDGHDPVADTPVSVFLSSLDDPRVCMLDDETWWPAVIKCPAFRYDLFDGAFRAGITAPTSTFSLAVDPIPHLPRYMLAGARTRVWTGTAGAAWADYTQRFDGQILNQPKIEDGLAEPSIAVDDSWLDTPLLTTYAGTGGIEGPADLKGQVKPLAIGAPRYVAGTLIDAVNIVFQISGYGAIVGVEAALERLVRFGASIGDFATYDALVAADIPAGRWGTCHAAGLVRFGAPTVGQVTFLVRGDAAGPDGWVRRPGDIIRRLALLAGGEGKIDDASLDALNSARPYNLSHFLSEQTTARELIQRVAASVNAVAGVSWLGKLFVAPVGIGEPALELKSDGSALPPVMPPRQVEVAAPYWKLSIQAERTYTLHALADVAFTASLTDLGDYAATTTYREGNIVQYGGGSWIYANPTPSAGNPPPPPPSTSNSWWRGLASRGADGVPGTNTAEVRIYQRAAALPDLPSGNVVFTFATGSMAGLDNGWGAAIPSGTASLYVSLATASASGETDTIAPGEWADPVVLVRDGINTANVALYQRNDTGAAPSAPAGDTVYTFATAALSGSLGGWSQGVPPANGGKYLFVTTAAALGTGATDTITPGEWATVQLMAQDGSDAFNGLSITLDKAIYSNGAKFADLGDDSRLAGRYAAQLAFADHSTARWCSPTAFKVSPGELLYYQHVVKSDGGPASETCNASISWYAADGSAVGATNLSSQTTVTLAEVNGVWTTKRATVVVPAGAASGQPYGERPTFTTNSFFIGEVSLSRAQPGATVGAPAGTNVGSTPAATVEAGGNAANAGVNSDGSIKVGKVSTGSIVSNGVTLPWYAEASGTLSFTGLGLTTVLSLSVNKEEAASTIEVGAQMPMTGPDKIFGNFLILISGAGSATRGLPIELDANNATTLPVGFEAYFSGLPAGAYSVLLQFALSDSGKTCSATGVRHIRIREFMK